MARVNIEPTEPCERCRATVYNQNYGVVGCLCGVESETVDPRYKLTGPGSFRIDDGPDAEAAR